MREKFFKLVLFMILFAGLNSIMAWIFVPADGASKKMWSNYKEMQELDMVYAGASVCQSTFNPIIIDEILGTNSHNMGTPSQPIDLSYVAVETAIKEHNIKRVILGFGYFALSTQNSRQAEAAFIQAKNQQGTVFEAVKANMEYIILHRGESVSVNFWIPWVNNHVKFNIDSIKENIQEKLKKDSAQQEKNLLESRGMLLYTDTLDYDNIGDDNSWNWYQPEFSKDAVSQMRRICELCNENKIELIVVNTPRPSFDITTYQGDYYGQYLWLKSFFEEYGVAYYDFNFAKPEIFVSKPEYFYNFEHMNVLGAEQFSESFAEFLQLIEKGADESSFFYDWEEYLASVNYD